MSIAEFLNVYNNALLTGKKEHKNNSVNVVKDLEALKYLTNVSNVAPIKTNVDRTCILVVAALVHLAGEQLQADNGVDDDDEDDQ